MNYFKAILINFDILVIGVVIGCFGSNLLQSIFLAGYEASARNFLSDYIQKNNTYFKNQGRYPKSLNALDLNYNKSNSVLVYHSDGKKFVLCASLLATGTLSKIDSSSPSDIDYGTFQECIDVALREGGELIK